MKPAKTVLLVDDDEDDCHIFQQIFFDKSKEGLLIIAHNGVEALSILSVLDDVPALLVTDLNMPMINGTELRDAIRLNSKYNSMNIVILSTSPFWGQDSEISGAYAKPSNMELYTEVVKEILDRFRIV